MIPLEGGGGRLCPWLEGSVKWDPSTATEGLSRSAWQRHASLHTRVFRPSVTNGQACPDGLSPNDNEAVNYSQIWLAVEGDSLRTDPEDAEAYKCYHDSEVGVAHRLLRSSMTRRPPPLVPGGVRLDKPKSRRSFPELEFRKLQMREVCKSVIRMPGQASSMTSRPRPGE